jgi:hypothetical protein
MTKILGLDVMFGKDHAKLGVPYGLIAVFYLIWPRLLVYLMGWCMRLFPPSPGDGESVRDGRRAWREITKGDA